MPQLLSLGAARVLPRSLRNELTPSSFWFVSPRSFATEASDLPHIPSLFNLTEEEEMLRDAGTFGRRERVKFS